MLCVSSVLLLTILLPPPQFDRAYLGKMFVVDMPIADVHAYCCGKPGAPRIFACAVPHGKLCLIVLPNVEAGVVSKQQRERLRRHEEGHCNGWLGAHAGGTR